jgi:predicted nucleic acid-binding protein
MLVVDTSAVVAALLSDNDRLRHRLGDSGDLHAPHLVDVELLHSLRRLLQTGTISSERAADLRTDFATLALVRYPHEPLGDRIWELRDNLTAFDAAFVALAEALGAPLITCDARLANAPGHDADVELYDAHSR